MPCEDLTKVRNLLAPTLQAQCLRNLYGLFICKLPLMLCRLPYFAAGSRAAVLLLEWWTSDLALQIILYAFCR